MCCWLFLIVIVIGYSFLPLFQHLPFPSISSTSAAHDPLLLSLLARGSGRAVNSDANYNSFLIMRMGRKGGIILFSQEGRICDQCKNLILNRSSSSSRLFAVCLLRFLYPLIQHRIKKWNLTVPKLTHQRVKCHVAPTSRFTLKNVDVFVLY